MNIRCATFDHVSGATKAFLLSFSEALAGECSGTDTRILTVCPGATQTDFFRAAGRGATEQLQAAPPMQSAREVVEVVLQALNSGQRLVVPGGNNRLMAVLAFTPAALAGAAPVGAGFEASVWFRC